jgi:hypothetical protein
MAGNSRQKKNLAVQMAMYFAERGYLVPYREFSSDPLRPFGLKLFTIKKIFGSWSIMVAYTKSFCPEIMKGLTDKKPEAVDPLVELKAKTADAE